MNWAEVFDGYAAQVDFPGTAVWSQLVAAFPESKVLHTERPKEEWWAGFGNAIGKFFRQRSTIALPPPVAEIFPTLDGLLVHGTSGRHMHRESVIVAYRRNNRKVRETVPAYCLLVFTPSDGWEPICRFLGVPGARDPVPAKQRTRRVFGPASGASPRAPLNLPRSHEGSTLVV